jgi:hypothetical protein
LHNTERTGDRNSYPIHPLALAQTDGQEPRAVTAMKTDVFCRSWKKTKGVWESPIGNK